MDIFFKMCLYNKSIRKGIGENKMTSLIAFGIGILFILWGSFRLSNDFKTNKTKKNMLLFALSGQASGLGQFLSGVVFIVIGIVSLLVQ